MAGRTSSACFCESIVVDLLRLGADAVVRDLVKFAGEIRRMAVGEMAAVGEIHGEDFVAGLQHGEINGHVRLRAAVRLDVDVFAPKSCFARSIASCSTVSTFSQPPYQRFPG